MIVDRIAQAIGDPGSIVGDRQPFETVTRWSTRAVLALPEVARRISLDPAEPSAAEEEAYSNGAAVGWEEGFGAGVAHSRGALDDAETANPYHKET